MRHTNYDDIAAAYDRRYVEDDYSDIERALIDFIGTEPKEAVEVGCGTGHWLRRLLSRGIRTAGVDLSWQMLRHARSKVPGSPLIQARAESLPFANDSFERAFSINAHHHFNDKLAFFGEARRLLRPGGSIMTIALDPHTGLDRWWVYDYFAATLQIDKERYPSCAEIRTWMRNSGFGDTYTREVQNLPGDVAATEALNSGLISPSHTSQLAVLTREEFETGIKRINAALEENKTLRLSADLRVYATFGTAA